MMQFVTSKSSLASNVKTQKTFLLALRGSVSQVAVCSRKMLRQIQTFIRFNHHILHHIYAYFELLYTSNIRVVRLNVVTTYFIQTFLLCLGSVLLGRTWRGLSQHIISTITIAPFHQLMKTSSFRILRDSSKYAFINRLTEIFTRLNSSI